MSDSEHFHSEPTRTEVAASVSWIRKLIQRKNIPSSPRLPSSFFFGSVF